MAKPYSEMIRLARACERVFGIPVRGEHTIYPPLIRIAQALEKTKVTNIDDAVLLLESDKTKFGYLYNNNFYEDSAHTKLMPKEGGLYIDISTTPGIYRYDGANYVQVISGGGGGAEKCIFEGYYHDNKFYKDAAHTVLISGKAESLFINLGSGNNDVFRWDGSNYLRTSKDYLSEAVADAKYAPISHTHSYEDINDVEYLTTAEMQALLNA